MKIGVDTSGCLIPDGGFDDDFKVTLLGGKYNG